MQTDPEVLRDAILWERHRRTVELKAECDRIILEVEGERDRLREAVESALRTLGDSSLPWVKAAIRAERVLKTALGPGSEGEDGD